MPRISARAVGWVAASLGLVPAVVWVGACVEVSGLGAIEIVSDAGSDAPPIPCTTAAQCDDVDPCTTDSCSAQGICVFAAIPDGDAPPTAQKKGTCQKVVCRAGVATSVEDDTNVPAGGSLCTTETCVNGAPAATRDPDGTPCALMMVTGVCLSGTCTLDCVTSAECAVANPCQVGSCDASNSQCVIADVTDGTLTPGFTQVPGDCVTHVCIGGADTAAPDPADVPAATSDCADPSCVNGSPMSTNHPADSPCSTYMTNQPGFCDGAGHCVGCTMDSECPGATSDCQHPACSSGACATAKADAGTPTTMEPPQKAGDCQTIACDGDGGTMMVANNSDPPTYPNDCKTGSCNNGSPMTVNAPNGTKCPTMAGVYMCINGQCGCKVNTDCQPPSYETCGGGGMAMICGCTPATCAAQSTTCGSTSDACGGMLDCNNGKQDPGETDVDCGGSTTCALRCARGKKCNATSDCQPGLMCADGVCCNTACTGSCYACTKAKTGQANGIDGVCQAVASGVTDPKGVCKAQQQSTCGDMSTACNGAGGCLKWPTNTVCAPAVCADPTTLTRYERCVSGACTPFSPPMVSCAPALCMAGACTTSCASDLDCAPDAFCGLIAHVCRFKKASGVACAANDQCQSGTCLTPTGVCK